MGLPPGVNAPNVALPTGQSDAVVTLRIAGDSRFVKGNGDKGCWPAHARKDCRCGVCGGRGEFRRRSGCHHPGDYAPADPVNPCFYEAGAPGGLPPAEDAARGHTNPVALLGFSLDGHCVWAGVVGIGKRKGCRSPNDAGGKLMEKDALFACDGWVLTAQIVNRRPDMRGQG